MTTDLVDECRFDERANYPRFYRRLRQNTDFAAKTGQISELFDPDGSAKWCSGNRMFQQYLKTATIVIHELFSLAHTFVSLLACTSHLTRVHLAVSFGIVFK